MKKFFSRKVVQITFMVIILCLGFFCGHFVGEHKVNMGLKQEYDSLWSCNKKLLSDIKESKRILESTSMLLRLEKKEHLASLQVACEFIKRINSYIIPLVSPRDAQKKAESITRAIEKNFVEMQKIKKEECDSLDTKGSLLRASIHYRSSLFL